MRHADDQFIGTGHAALLDEIVQHRDQAIPTFQGKALLSHVTRMQVALDAFRRDQLFEQPQPDFVRQATGDHAFFELLAQPEPFTRL